MRINIIIIALCVVLGFLATFALDYQQRPRSARVAENSATDNYKSAPDITFTAIDGKSFKLSDYKGKLVLLNFWATWCAPCKVEFPQMLELAVNDKDIIFLAVSVDENSEDIARFLKSQKRTHVKHADVKIAHDPEKEIAQDTFQVLKYPETVIISPSGKMTDKVVGALDWLSPQMKERLEKLKAL